MKRQSRLHYLFQRLNHNHTTHYVSPLLSLIPNMPRIPYMISYIPSVTLINSLDHTSLTSTNAVSIHGLSSSVGKIVTSRSYMVMNPVSSLSLTIFEHYENLVNTSSNSTRRHPYTSRRLRSMLSINSVHISSVIQKHPVHRFFTIHPHQRLAYDPPGPLPRQVIQPFLQDRLVMFHDIILLPLVCPMMISIPIMSYRVNQDFVTSLHHLSLLVDQDHTVLILTP